MDSCALLLSSHLMTMEEMCRASLTLFLCISSFSLHAYLCESVPTCVFMDPSRLTLFLSVLWYIKRNVYDCVSVVLLFSLLLIFPTSCFSKVSVSHFEVPQRSNRERTRAQISSIVYIYIYIYAVDKHLSTLCIANLLKVHRALNLPRCLFNALIYFHKCKYVFTNNPLKLLKSFINLSNYFLYILTPPIRYRI